jgi:pimeloyl-ACP methyl ester carboxylesterase
MLDGLAATEPLARLDAAATRHETPCGDGAMVWRNWGAGEPLVLLHGGTGSWRHWVRNVEALACDRRVLAPDLPGLGESALPPPVQDPGEIAAIVAAGLDRLLGVGARYDIAGFSFGALVSGHVAAREGRRLRSVTIVGAGALGVPRQPTPLVKVRDKAGEARVEAHRANLSALMLADPSRIDALALAIQEWNTVHARFKSRGFAHTTSLRDALARAEAPLNAIWGERDAIAWPHVADRVAVIRALRPDANVAVIPGAGHWVAYEAAEQFNTTLDGMLHARP